MNKIVFAFFLLIQSNFIVNAEMIDTNAFGSLNIHNVYGNKYINDNEVYVYRIADINYNGEFQYTDEFKISNSLDNLSSSDWHSLALVLDNYIQVNHISYLDKCITNNEGFCDIDNLKVGLYLVASEDVIDGDYKYSSNPSLISIPNYDGGDNNYLYDINVYLKSEKKYIKKDENSNLGNNNVPQTLDRIYNYLLGFILSLIIVVVLFKIVKKLRKRL